jgi:hypothetical protein
VRGDTGGRSGEGDLERVPECAEAVEASLEAGRVLVSTRSAGMTAWWKMSPGASRPETRGRKAIGDDETVERRGQVAQRPESSLANGREVARRVVAAIRRCLELRFGRPCQIASCDANVSLSRMVARETPRRCCFHDLLRARVVSSRPAKAFMVGGGSAGRSWPRLSRGFRKVQPSIPKSLVNKAEQTVPSAAELCLIEAVSRRGN